MEKHTFNKILEIFKSSFSIKDEEIDCEVSIKEQYGIDSLDIIEFIVRLEKEINITFEDDDLIDDNLYSVNSIAKIVQKRIESNKII